MNRLAHSSRFLRRTLFAVSALLLAGAVHAEWFPLGRTTAMRLYLDQKLIAKNGDIAQIVQLMDFTTSYWVDAQTVVGSVKILTEYDCAKPRSRVLSSEAFSEQMGDGRRVSKEEFSDAQWQGVEPDSTSEKVRQIACGKK
jgi:hypothetical protein